MELLRDQHGVGRVRQAHQLGIPEHRIKQMKRGGRLRGIRYGIIAAPGAPESLDFRSMLGVLLGGHGLTEGIVAALAGPSAACRLDLMKLQPEKIHVVSTRTIRSEKEFEFHRTGRLPQDEVRIIDGIPVTDPIRTYLDYCALQPPWRAKSLYYRGLREGALEKETVLERIGSESRQGRQGLQLAREIALATTPGAEKARSGWEEMVMGWILEARLPAPERNILIPSSFGFDWEIDLLYRRPPIAIEVSPWDTHGDPDTYIKDNRKREDLESMGYRVMVVTEESQRYSFLERLRTHLGAT